MVRYLVTLAAAACLTAAAPEPRDEALSLSPGQAVLITIGDGGEVAIVGIEMAGPLNAFEAAAARQMLANPQDAIGPKSAPLGKGLPPPPPVARGRIRIALVEFEGGKSRLLLIENGYDRGFRYRATLRQGDRSQPTDVCAVLPGIRGYEHWPYKFSQIDLRDLRLVPMRQGEPPICE